MHYWILKVYSKKIVCSLNRLQFLVKNISQFKDYYYNELILLKMLLIVSLNLNKYYKWSYWYRDVIISFALFLLKLTIILLILIFLSGL